MILAFLLFIGTAHAQITLPWPVTSSSGASVCSSFVTDYSIPCNLIVATTTGLGL